MKIQILHTAERARTDEEFREWLGEMFRLAGIQFHQDSGTESDFEIQYNESLRRVRVFNHQHDFTYSVTQLTGSINPIPSTAPETEQEWIIYGESSDASRSNKRTQKVTKTVDPVGPTGPKESGYRLLELGETVETDDEFYIRGTNQWKTTSCVGHVVFPNSLAYRRKIAA